MTKKFSAFLAGLTFATVTGSLLMTTGCSKNEDAPPSTGLTSDTLSGSISTDVTLRSGNTYYLNGVTFITGSKTLKIEPGVVIKGIKGTKACLIITKGAKIDAQGTAAQPIVFTSNQPAGSRNPGDWGGIVLIGYASVNAKYGGLNNSRLLEGFDNAEAAAYGSNIIGGSRDNSPMDTDNSGTMKYVRIEFPGIALSSTANSELNGLTLLAIGSGTTLDHIQVSYSGDDSFEWFGGKVNAKYLIAYRGLDDDFDTDNGYTGKVQFGFSVRDNSIYDVSAGASNGFESDNEDPVLTPLSTPLTAPVFSNITLVGPGAFVGNASINANFGRAALLRRGTQISIFNSVVMGWANGINIDGVPSNDAVAASQLEIKNTYVAGFPVGKFMYSTGSSGGYNAATTFMASANANDTSLTTVTGLGLANLVLGSSIDVRPTGTSILLNKASFTSTKLSGLTTVTYVGAFSGTSDTWATTWTEYDPKNKTY